MDRGVRRRRPAVRRASARRSRRPRRRRIRGSPRPPRGSSTAPTPTRSWPPGSPGTISPRSRRASSPAASRAPRSARSTRSWRTSTSGARRPPVAVVGDGPRVHRARARAEAVAHAGRPARRRPGSASTRTRCAPRSGRIAARPRVDAIRRARRPAPRWGSARSTVSASSISPSGSPVRWPRPSWRSSAPTSSWWSCPSPPSRQRAAPAGLSRHQPQ